MRYPAAASPPITVGPVQPTLGWAATPTGLSTTTRSSSSWITAIPGTGSATTASPAEAGGSGSDTSSQAPAHTRSDLPTVRWSTVTAPAVARSAALVRDRPKRRARAESTRSPSRPSGTGSERTSDIVIGSCRVLGRLRRSSPVLGLVALGLVVLGLVTGHAGSVDADAPESHHGEQDRCTDDGRVGDVENGIVRQLQEVHHVSTTGPRSPEHAVGQVAQRSAEQQPQRQRPASAAQASSGDHDEQDYSTGDHRQDPGRSGGDREGSAGVTDQVEL